MPDSLQTIQNQVDSILFEEGSFSSISWLLREGHLDYTDYLNWRMGGTGFLEDHLKTGLTEVIANLKLVQRYATKLKLDAVCEPCASIDQQRLNICRSLANEKIFSTVYEPAKNRVQMDLFFDSAPVLAAKDLISAMVDRRDEDIPRSLTRLKALAPEKCRSFEGLLAQQKQWAGYPDTQSKIESLLLSITPSAYSLLGRFANDFITPFWQQLSLELSERRFSPEHPEDHLSFTAFKGFQWREVISAIERETDWNLQPDLLFRYAEACFKLNQEAQGLENWFRLFVLFPERGAALLRSTGNYLLLSDWRKFNELDPELEAACFPAWMVLKKPALAKLPVDGIDENIANDSLQLIRNLAACRDAGVSENTINLRARLRERHPSLFDHYMQARR